MNPHEETSDNFWDLLAEVSRLQGQMARGLVSWSQAYQAAGRAFESNAETLDLMASVGRRAERYMRTGPPAAVRQVMQLFTGPLQGMAGGPGSGTGDPFSRLWEAWASTSAKGSEGTRAEGEGTEETG